MAITETRPTSNLPAYLQQSQGRALNDIATSGLGTSIPPHISIQGNSFTLIDAAGNEQPEGATLDVCVADISDVTCKRYYDKKWEPDSKDPPVCWSANGVAPSREATIPQSPTCGVCPKNERGSATSAISGVAIKACRDEKWLALIAPKYATMRFQLVLTPGSFTNWKAYLEKCKASQTDLRDIVTRLTFEPKVNGVLQFSAVNYIDEATAKAREAGYTEKAFDVLVGRNDVPIQRALPGPVSGPLEGALLQQQALAAPAQPAASQTPPAAFSAPQTGFAAPAAASGSGFGSPLAQPTGTAVEQPTQRRKRRTAAEIAADNAATTRTASAAPGVAPMAPFRLAHDSNTGFGAAPANPTGSNFGMQAGVEPNPEITSALNSLFGQK